MEAKLFFIFAIVFFTLSGILGITSIILFIRLRIPAVVDELSGRRERKQIAEIRQENKESQKRNNRVKMFEARSGSTGRIAPTAQISAPKDTENLVEDDQKTAVLEPDLQPTEEYGNTILLEDVNDDSDEQTRLLDEEGTVVLKQEDQKTDKKNMKVTVVRSIFVTDSKEVLRG